MLGRDNKVSKTYERDTSVTIADQVCVLNSYLAPWTLWRGFLSNGHPPKAASWPLANMGSRAVG